MMCDVLPKHYKKTAYFLHRKPVLTNKSVFNFPEVEKNSSTSSTMITKFQYYTANGRKRERLEVHYEPIAPFLRNLSAKFFVANVLCSLKLIYLTVSLLLIFSSRFNSLLIGIPMFPKSWRSLIYSFDRLHLAVDDKRQSTALIQIRLRISDLNHSFVHQASLSAQSTNATMLYLFGWLLFIYLAHIQVASINGRSVLRK